MTSKIPLNWLRDVGTPEEFERTQLESMATGFHLPYEKVVEKFGARPFGTKTEEWREFVKDLSDGDQLWSFSSPEHTFAKKLGCAGFAIVREGAVRKILITLMT